MRYIEILEWDSRFFGFNIGRVKVDPHQIRPEILNEAMEEARASKIKCLYIETGFNDPELLQYCTENQLSLVDFKTTLGKKLEATIKAETLNTSHFEMELKGEYYPYLEKIVGQISSQSRYAMDQRFGIQKSLALYTRWLRNSFYESFADEFIIYVKDAEPMGFITIRMKNKIPFIDLLGVLNENIGKGIGSALIEAVEDRMVQKGHQMLKITTQGHNIRALRTYEGMGFQMECVNVFYHKWLDK